ncbi:MAG: valine--tRNA ligase, partial [Nanoarchaeota archaeon]|nr:valine--tRNA ligase [Nanoarchaeota archaeon]
TDVLIEGETALLEKHQEIITSLVKIQNLHFNPKEMPSGFTSSISVQGFKIVIPLPESLQEKEKERLAKEKEKLEKQIASLKSRLSNPQFVEKAPQELVEQIRAQLKEAEDKLA